MKVIKVRHTEQTQKYLFQKGGDKILLMEDLVEGVKAAKRHGWSVNDFNRFVHKIMVHTSTYISFNWEAFKRHENHWLDKWHSDTPEGILEVIYDNIVANIEVKVSIKSPSIFSVKQAFGPNEAQRARSVAQNLKGGN